MKRRPAIVCASSNTGKIREISALLASWPYQLVPQKELGIADIPETASSFVENALIKARHAAQAAQLPALADDSGLAVEALQGAPGIYSARYAGVSASDGERYGETVTGTA